jgi:hypothetical protein
MDESGLVHMTAEEEKRLSKLNTMRSSNGSSNLPPVNANTNNLTTGIKKPLRPVVLAESWEFLNGRTDSPLATPSEGSIAGSSAWSDISRTRFEAESPDELALVRAAATYGCCLKKRSHGKITVFLPGKFQV